MSYIEIERKKIILVFFNRVVAIRSENVTFHFRLRQKPRGLDLEVVKR